MRSLAATFAAFLVTFLLPIFVFGEVLVVDSIAFSPDGKYLLFSERGGYIKVLNVSQKTFEGGVKRIDSGDRQVHRMAFSPDGKTLLTSDGYWMVFYDFASGKILSQVGPTVESKTGSGQLISFIEDGKSVLTGRKIYDVASGKEIKKLIEDKVEVSAAASSPDGSLLATAEEKKSYIDLRDMSGKVYKKINTGNAWDVWHMVLSPRDKILGVWSRGEKEVRFVGKFCLWDIVSGKKVFEHPLVYGESCYFQFSPDGKLVYFTQPSKSKIAVYDLSIGKVIQTLSGPFSGTTYLSLNQDGSTLATASFNSGDVILWDTKSGTSNFCYRSDAALAAEEKAIAGRLAEQTEKLKALIRLQAAKKEIQSLLADAENDFAVNQGDLDFEDSDDNSKYFISKISLGGTRCFIQSKKDAQGTFKAFVCAYDPKGGKSVSKDLATLKSMMEYQAPFLEEINARHQSGKYKGRDYTDDAGNGVTELKDQNGNQVMLISSSPNKMKLIIYGKSWGKR